MASLAKKLLGGFAAAALVATPTIACAEENTANTTTTESTAAANQNGTSPQSQCVTYERIDLNLTIVGSGTRIKDSGNTTIQVAITPERNFFIFENNSEDPNKGCYETRVRGTGFKGNDFTTTQTAPASVTFSTEEAKQQCRDLGFQEGGCIPHENIIQDGSKSFNTAFTGTFASDNLVTFQASQEGNGGWSLYRTFNQGATTLTMIGTNFEWAPEVRKFYEQQRHAAR